MSNQDGHPLALEEALTAVCADEQGRSWDYHNLLFSDQPNLTEESFSSFAVELGFSTTPTFLMGRRLTFPTIAEACHQEFGLAWEVRNAVVWVNLTKN